MTNVSRHPAQPMVGWIMFECKVVSSRCSCEVLVTSRRRESGDGTGKRKNLVACERRYIEPRPIHITIYTLYSELQGGQGLAETVFRLLTNPRHPRQLLWVTSRNARVVKCIHISCASYQNLLWLADLKIPQYLLIKYVSVGLLTVAPTALNIISTQRGACFASQECMRT